QEILDLPAICVRVDLLDWSGHSHRPLVKRKLQGFVSAVIATQKGWQGLLVLEKSMSFSFLSGLGFTQVSRKSRMCLPRSRRSLCSPFQAVFASLASGVPPSNEYSCKSLPKRIGIVAVVPSSQVTT